MRPLVGLGVAGFVAACSLTLAPDAALTGGADAAGCDLEAGVQAAGCWLWTATTTDGWTIDNSALTADGAPGTTDCCGCATCASCTDNTSLSAQSGVITFDSGPEMSAGLNHRRDGFTARYANVPVIPNRAHLLDLDVVGLDANLACGDATQLCNNPQTEYLPPTWSITVLDGANQAGTVSGSWATSQCKSCPSGPGDWGVKPVSFTPSSDAVTVVVTAQHRTSQCASEAWGVTLSMDWMSVVAQ